MKDIKIYSEVDNNMKDTKIYSEVDKYMNKNNPLIIRLFISSTFVDMQGERNYLNDFIFPKIKKECDDVGISFFPIDLRWGITEEQQKEGLVPIICLQEVENCLPYFIGIIGDRYGSIMNDKNNIVWNQFEKIKEYYGRSITELEIRYGAFINDNLASFYLKEINNSHDELLDNLKKDIISSKKYVIYKTIEEFGDAVYKDLHEIIELHKKSITDLTEVKQKLYIDNSVNNCVVEDTNINDFLNDNSYKGNVILIGSNTGGGKSTLALKWCSLLKEKKILVNINADVSFKNVYNVISYLYKKICLLFKDCKRIALENNILDNTDLLPYDQTFFDYEITDDNLINNKASIYSKQRLIQYFVKWISTLELKEKLTILINDVDSLYDYDALNMLNWLPNITSKMVQIIVTTNSDFHLRVAEIKKWVLYIDKTKFEPNVVVEKYLSIYGKSISNVNIENILKNAYYQNVSNAIKLCDSLLIISDYTIIDSYIDKQTNTKDVLQFLDNVLECLIDNQELRNICKIAMYVLSNSSFGLVEDSIYNLINKMCDNKLNLIEWATIVRIINVFAYSKSGRICINSKENRDEFVKAFEYLVDKEKYLQVYKAELIRIIKDSSDYSIRDLALFEYLNFSYENDLYEDMETIISNFTYLDILSDYDWKIIRKIVFKLMQNNKIEIKELFSKFIDEFKDISSDGLLRKYSNNFQDTINKINSKYNIENSDVLYYKILSLFTDMYLWRDEAAIVSADPFEMNLSSANSELKYTTHLDRDRKVSGLSMMVDQGMINDKMIPDFVKNCNELLFNEKLSYFDQIQLLTLLLRFDTDKSLFDSRVQNLLDCSYASGSNYEISNSLGLIAAVYYQNGETDKALDYCLKAIDYSIDSSVIMQYMDSASLFASICSLEYKKIDNRLSIKIEDFILDYISYAKKADREKALVTSYIALATYYENAAMKNKINDLLTTISNELESHFYRVSSSDNYLFEKDDLIYNISAIANLAGLLLEYDYKEEAEKCYEFILYELVEKDRVSIFEDIVSYILDYYKGDENKSNYIKNRYFSKFGIYKEYKMMSFDESNHSVIFENKYGTCIKYSIVGSQIIEDVKYFFLESCKYNRPGIFKDNNGELIGIDDEEFENIESKIRSNNEDFDKVADTIDEIQRKLFDEESDEVIYVDIHGIVIGMNQIAVLNATIENQEKTFAILQPENFDDDGALVFEMIGDENLDDFVFVTDDSIVEKVFDEYYKLVEEHRKNS